MSNRRNCREKESTFTIFEVIYFNYLCSHLQPFTNEQIGDNIPVDSYLVFLCIHLLLCLSSLLEITDLIASLIRREGKQAIISSQEDKQSINFKKGVIKRCKKNYFAA